MFTVLFKTNVNNPSVILLVRGKIYSLKLIILLHLLIKSGFQSTDMESC